MPDVIKSAFVADTDPKPFQVVPSVEYCQVPFPVLDVMAMPLSAPVSTSAQEADVRMDVTVVPEEVVFSSVPVRVTVAAFVIVGASLTALTTSEAVSVAVENAVVPPDPPDPAYVIVTLSA